jgi:Uma2 family endonuclease
MSTEVQLPLVTSEKFFALSERTENFSYELHFGELVEVGRPNKQHFDLQCKIRDVLSKALDAKKWLIEIEMPYGLTPTYDVRAADVGVCARKAWDAVPGESYLIGSPKLVVQVKSRSNRDRKMGEDAIAHITHGASAVWLVKPARREIIVVTASSRRVYGQGQQIALPFPAAAMIAVDEIFPRNYSSRNAVMGSIRIARRDGR